MLRRERVKKREALLAKRLSGQFEFRLVVQLQSELDLPRIVGSVAGGADFAEGGAVVVAGVGDGSDAVAAEVGGVEIRMVEDVEEFGPELKTETLVELEVLEEGDIKAVEARTWHLGYASESVCSG